MGRLLFLAGFVLLLTFASGQMYEGSGMVFQNVSVESNFSEEKLLSDDSGEVMEEKKSPIVNRPEMQQQSEQLLGQKIIPEVKQEKRNNAENAVGELVDSSLEPNQTHWAVLHNLTPDNFNFTNPSLPKNTTLLILVPVKPSDTERRDQIRTSWGSQNNSKKIKQGLAKVIFVVAEDKPSTKILEENTKYNDILVVPGSDVYKKLVYKVSIAFRWANFFHPTKIVAKVDSDVVVVVDNLYKTAIMYNNTKAILGYTWSSATIRREPNHHWYIPYSVYSHMYLPTYVNGPCYIIEPDAMTLILLKSYQSQVFEVEDAYFTGFLAQKANGVYHVHINEMMWHKPTKLPCDGNDKSTLISFPVDEGENVRFEWENMKTLKCANTVGKFFDSIRTTFFKRDEEE